jgi:DNA-binding IclR family transcriptional regulator
VSTVTRRNETDCDTPRADAVAAILTSPTITAAAESIGVSRATVYRWLEDAAFQADIAEARRRAFEAALARLESGVEAIVAELFTIARDGEVGATTRVSACRAYLDAAFHSHETFATADRIRELEETVKELRSGIEARSEA